MLLLGSGTADRNIKTSFRQQSEGTESEGPNVPTNVMQGCAKVAASTLPLKIKAAEVVDLIFSMQAGQNTVRSLPALRHATFFPLDGLQRQGKFPFVLPGSRVIRTAFPKS